MPRELLVDPSVLTLDNMVLDQEGVQEWIPQRFEMQQIDGIVYNDAESMTAVGYQEVRDDAFWVRGHIPGRPLMPGVMQLEACAQVCTYIYMSGLQQKDRFMGFGAVNDVRFRGIVTPGMTLYLVAHCTRLTRKFARFDTQGVVDGNIVFEAQITGVDV